MNHRFIHIRINGDIIGTFESYIGSTFKYFDIEKSAVESLTMDSVGIATAEWISVVEVGNTSKAEGRRVLRL